MASATSHCSPCGDGNKEKGAALRPPLTRESTLHDMTGEKTPAVWVAARWQRPMEQPGLISGGKAEYFPSRAARSG